MKNNNKNGKKKMIKQNTKYYTEEQEEIRKFVIIILAIIFVVAIVYFITDRFVDSNTNSSYVEGKINYDVLSVGTLLNRPYDEYYVVAYDKDNLEATNYSAMITSYMEKEASLKIYFLNLGNKINQKYYNVNSDNISNPNAKKISELDFGDLTLLKIQNGEIVSYIEGFNEISAILK